MLEIFRKTKKAWTWAQVVRKKNRKINFFQKIKPAERKIYIYRHNDQKMRRKFVCHFSHQVWFFIYIFLPFDFIDYIDLYLPLWSHDFFLRYLNCVSTLFGLTVWFDPEKLMRKKYQIHGQIKSQICIMLILSKSVFFYISVCGWGPRVYWVGNWWALATIRPCPKNTLITNSRFVMSRRATFFYML